MNLIIAVCEPPGFTALNQKKYHRSVCERNASNESELA